MAATALPLPASEPEVPGPRARADLWVVVALALFALAIRGAWIGDPNADSDEQLYSIIGRAMTGGALPYVDLWDRKPFGLFGIFALAHWIGGAGSAPYQLLAAAFVTAGGWLAYRYALALVDRVTALGAGLLTIALMSTYGAHSANAEAFFVPLMLAMALLLRDPGHRDAGRRAMLAMLLGGVALQIKYTAIPQCLMLGAWALWAERARGAAMPRLVRRAALYAALGLLPSALVMAFYALVGAWDAFWFANFQSFFLRTPSDAGRFYPELGVFLAPLALLAAGGLYAAWRMTPPRDGPSYRLAALWLASCLVTVFLPGTVYLYYFAALVPAAVLVALPLIDRRGPAGIVPLVLLIAGALYIQFLPRDYRQSQVQRAEAARLAQAIAPRLARGGGCLWIYDGPPSLYRMTGSCLPTRFVYPDHLNNLLERDALGISQSGETARILAARPPVIVTADTAVTPLNPVTRRLVAAALADGYTEFAHAQIGERTIRAWARR